MLLGLVGDGIVVAYDRDSAALRRYEGISNIRNEDGESCEVRVEFPAGGTETTGRVFGAVAAVLIHEESFSVHTE